MAEINGDGMKLGQRLKHAWSVFTGREQQIIQQQYQGPSFSTRPDRVRYHFGSERTILASIYTRIAMDVSQIQIRHVRVDGEGRYIEDMVSGLNYCLDTEANIDQSDQAFMQDLVMSILDDGCAAAVPVKAVNDPLLTGSYDIKEMRVGKVVEWFPKAVRVNLYNDVTGQKQDFILSKQQVAIIENPLYAVMNEPISTLKRLIYKLNQLDQLDDKNASSKLDLIIQLPYDLRTELKRQEAEKRRQDIETQLTDNKFGIAYASSTEKITQLNRAVENKLMDEIEYLTSMLYSQLGMTKEVLEGGANEVVMRNYFRRTIKPIVSAITKEFNRKFLTKTARSQGQRVMFFNSLFELGTLDEIANAGASMVASEILTRNEVRQLVGFKPADEERADQLMNPNINPQTGELMEEGMIPEEEAYPEEGYEEDVSGEDIPLTDILVKDIPE